MKMYNEYANNYVQAANLLAAKLVLKEGKINVFAQKLWVRNVASLKSGTLISAYIIKKELEQASGEGNPLPALIIMPIQRIPRYNLLLADLLKNTPRSHADREKISAALGTIQSINHAKPFSVYLTAALWRKNEWNRELYQ